MTPKQAARLAELRRLRTAGPHDDYKNMDGNVAVGSYYLLLERKIASAAAYKAVKFAIRGTALGNKEPYVHWDRSDRDASCSMGVRDEDMNYQGGRVTAKVHKGKLHMLVADATTDEVVWKKTYGGGTNLSGPAIDAGHEIKKLIPFG